MSIPRSPFFQFFFNFSAFFFQDSPDSPRFFCISIERHHQSEAERERNRLSSPSQGSPPPRPDTASSSSPSSPSILPRLSPLYRSAPFLPIFPENRKIKALPLGKAAGKIRKRKKRRVPAHAPSAPPTVSYSFPPSTTRLSASLSFP